MFGESIGVLEGWQSHLSRVAQRAKIVTYD
jgi:hypothetical protein